MSLCSSGRLATLVLALLGACTSTEPDPTAAPRQRVARHEEALTCDFGPREIPCNVDADCTVDCADATCTAGRCRFCYHDAGTVCRAARDVCDSAEVCDGATTACPADGRQPAGTVCRAAADVCDAVESCTGAADACPANSFRAAGTSCRASAGSCDVAETCSGASAACPADAFLAAGAQCRASAGACDVAETCSGAGAACPGDAFLAAGTQCRASAGVCDVAESCSGAGAQCPGNGFVAAGTQCRAAAGVCDARENCTGNAAACPADGFLGNGTTCRAAAGACDAAEVCPGNAINCPALDAKRAAGTQCRAASGGCDLRENCDGVSDTCPADGPRQPAGFVCRAAADPFCDVAETCDGVAAACPANGFQNQGLQCRAANGVCDVADVCNNGNCPNGFVANGTLCRAAVDVCDAPENCPGNNANCPADGRRPAGFVCRASVAPCDATETCTGAANACPADAVSPNGTVCRAAAGTCDVPETCNGVLQTCPADALQPAGALCRAANGACDVSELCSGGGANCPANGFSPAGTLCRASAGTCDAAESCSGGSASCPNDAFTAAGTQCRAPVGTCDARENCPGNSAFCPADGSVPNGTVCDADGTVCDGVDTCSGGNCQVAPGGPNCDDGNPCTADSCDPVLGCRNTPVANGTACDDGQYCTVSDACQAGVCTGPARDCGVASQECLVADCDEANDVCHEVPNPLNIPCEDDSIKPYMMVILDNSGTMDANTGAGQNSCAQERTRMSDAKCVLQTIVSSYGDFVFGLERFTESCTGSCSGTCPGTCGGTCPATCNSCDCDSLSCSTCNPDTPAGQASGCPVDGGSADQGQILTPIVDDNQAEITKWIDYECDSCLLSGADPELSPDTWTPIAGSLRAARRYFEDGDPTYPTPIDDANACRPYYVILITDGVESCTLYTDTVAAATELRNTTVAGVTYDIHTYTIGIGIPNVGFNADRLTEIATAGGTTPYFADDEESLALAFAQILEDSILVEVCNGVDDDCDGLIDEGFTLYCDMPGGHPVQDLCVDPGDPCNDVDDNCHLGVSDEVRNGCGGCGAAPVEVCNRLDDDCDGQIDEPPADCACIAEAETCDAVDNDCDGPIDEDLSRGCGSDVGICTRGTETCANGAWGACTGVPPEAESCNGLDDDCDGVVDGFAEPCGPEPVGDCLPGIEICGNGAWGPCVGGVGPSQEFCDGGDNDCDGETDEEDPAVGTPCETVCGSGALRCVAGELACVALEDNELPELCNNFDDDCDGLVDEDIESRGPCDGGGTLCIPGEEECHDGSWQCVGGQPPEAEVCDCQDNDCDGGADEGADCGGGATCLGEPYCQCAPPCDPNYEFLCTQGRVCTNIDDPARGWCVIDQCSGVECPEGENGEHRVCVAGDCVDVCDTVGCVAPLVCEPTTGRCVEDDCEVIADRCAPEQLCVHGACVDDPCAGVECVAVGEFCQDGACRRSCAEVLCPPGESCEAGDCVPDPCADVDCGDGLVCDPGAQGCVPDLCTDEVECPPGEACQPLSGECAADECLGVQCPAGQHCEDGDCWGPGGPLRPPVADKWVLATGGGGGCSCRIGAGGDATGGAAPSAGLLLLGLVAVLGWRRSR